MQGVGILAYLVALFTAAYNTLLIESSLLICSAVANCVGGIRTVVGFLLFVHLKVQCQ